MSRIVDGRRAPRRGALRPAALGRTLDELRRAGTTALVRGTTPGEPATALTALAISVAPGRQGQRLSRPHDRERSRTTRAQPVSSISCRARAADLEGALPARPDRALHRLDGATTAHIDPVAPHARARRRRDRRARARVDDDHRARRGRGRSGRACASPRTASTSFRAALAPLIVGTVTRHARRAERLVLHRCLGVASSWQGARRLPRSTTTRPSRSSERTASSSSRQVLAAASAARRSSRRGAAGTSLRRPLLAQRRVARSPRRAARRERADAAARHPREADGRAEIHQRLRARPLRTPRPSASRRVRRSRRRAARPRRTRSNGAPPPCTARRPAARQVGRPTARRQPAVRPGAGSARAGCSRAPATRGSRRPAWRLRATRRSASARATRDTAAGRARPASAGA